MIVHKLFNNVMFMFMTMTIANTMASMTSLCPPSRPSHTTCQSIGNKWNSLKSLIESASDGDTLNLCGFIAEKSDKEDPIILKQEITITCAEGQICILRGNGKHFEIKGKNAKVTIQGFEFYDATDSAIYLKQQSNGSVHLFCDCIFKKNRSDLRGGAARIWTGAKARFESCQFIENHANNGGAIYANSDAVVEIYDSTFDSNLADLLGGAVRASSTGLVNIASSTFIDNDAGQGSVVVVDGAQQWIDGGRNIVTNEVECEVLSFDPNECLGNFVVVSTQVPSLSPSNSPSNSPSSTPTLAPSFNPTPKKSSFPSSRPTAASSMSPSPSSFPSSTPSNVVSSSPSSMPTTSSLPTATTRTTTETAMPSTMPSSVQSAVPSAVPFAVPSTLPSAMPTTVPSSVPSFEQSAIPSSTLSSAPSADNNSTAAGRGGGDISFLLDGPDVDDVKPLGYFNYDINDPLYGPNVWATIPANETSEYAYWIGYQDYIRPELDNNRCDSMSHKQSPIDINQDVIKAQCKEYHQIRGYGGDFELSNEDIEKQILPNKLRLVYPYRNSSIDLLPAADIPKGWGKHMDVLHIDVKIPSDHTINGTRYAAEYRIYHLQGHGRKFGDEKDYNRGAAVITVLIDLDDDDDNINDHFQQFLNAFEEKFSDDAYECAQKQQRRRRQQQQQQQTLQTQQDYSYQYEDNNNSNGQWTTRRGIRSSTQSSRNLAPSRWNPYDESLLRSIWFYGYWGSLTEPPCTEFIHWRIIDTPAIISKGQFQQLQSLLYNHVDPDTCEFTSNHYEGGDDNNDHPEGYARPQQDAQGRDVWQCSCVDFLSDDTREAECRRNCLKPLGSGNKDQDCSSIDGILPPV